MTPAPETKRFILKEICKGDEQEYEGKFGWMSPLDAEYAVTRWIAESRGYAHPMLMFTDLYKKEVDKCTNQK